MKKTHRWLSAFVSVALAFAVAGCQIDLGIHKHSFSKDWTSDATDHWHAATCGCEDLEVQKNVHIFGEWQVTKAATEEDEGSRKRSCKVCGYTATEVIEKLAHTHKFATDWTKDETHHWHAATCEHTDETSGFAAHSFGEYVSNNDATTETDGTKTRECSVCGYKDTVTDEGSKIHVHTFEEEWSSDETNHWHASTCGHTTEISGKAAHSFGDWTVTKEATEEAEGTKERSCTICGYTATEAIEKLAHTHKFAEEWTKDETHHWHAAICEHTTEVSGKEAHSFGDWTVTKAATEEAEGSKERSCNVCGYTATEVIPELDHTHTFAVSWTSDSTNHWHSATCGHDVIDSKAAHSFGDWTVTKAATEEAEGSKERSCSVCGYTATEVIEKLAHTHKFATDWTKDKTYHWHAATCGHTTEVSGKAAHSFGDWTVTKAATCTEKGSRKRTCSVCKYEVTEDISAKGHAYSKDWTSNATDHWHAATCGHTTEVSGKAKHTFGDWIVTKAATKEAKGSKERVCTVCNYKEVVDIAKIPENFVLIPAGTFQMGSEKGNDDNKPVHQVTITKSFYMGKYEVTQAEYEKYCSYGSSSPSSDKGDGDNYPAYYVSWYDALVYCNKRSMAEGLTPCYSINGITDPSKWGTVPTSDDSTWNAVVCNWNANGYRLPTEAEWEYAARARDNTVDSLTYSGTSDVNKLGEYAWYFSNQTNINTHEVGTKKANGFGLYDMSGNVSEWCWNMSTNSYDAKTEGGSDPTGSSAGSARVYRVYRGGGWSNYSDYCAVSCRYGCIPGIRFDFFGFRVVRSSSK